MSEVKLGQEAGCNRSIPWASFECEVNWAHFFLGRIGNAEKQQLCLALKSLHFSTETIVEGKNKSNCRIKVLYLHIIKKPHTKHGFL